MTNIEITLDVSVEKFDIKIGYTNSRAKKKKKSLKELRDRNCRKEPPLGLGTKEEGPGRSGL